MRSLTRDELDLVSGGLGALTINFFHSGGDARNTIGTATGGNSGGTTNTIGGNGGPGGAGGDGYNGGTGGAGGAGGAGGDAVTISVVSNS